MSDRFEVQRLDGYADGKPSWRKVLVPNSSTFGRAAIEVEVAKLEAVYPTTKYRVRKSRKPKER